MTSTASGDAVPVEVEIPRLSIDDNRQQRLVGHAPCARAHPTVAVLERYACSSDRAGAASRWCRTFIDLPGLVALRSRALGVLAKEIVHDRRCDATRVTFCVL